MYMYLRFYSIQYLILKICIINYQLNNNHEFPIHFNETHDGLLLVFVNFLFIQHGWFELKN